MSLAATQQRPSLASERAPGHAFTVTVIVLIVLVIWYVAAIPMNRVLTQPLIDAAGSGLMDTLSISWSLPRPVLPAPHQVIAELWNTIFTTAPWRPRSLLYHCWVTLSPPCSASCWARSSASALPSQSSM
jgi:NitT/TauT family transport system permease protein